MRHSASNRGSADSKIEHIFSPTSYRPQLKWLLSYDVDKNGRQNVPRLMHCFQHIKR